MVARLGHSNVKLSVYAFDTKLSFMRGQTGTSTRMMVVFSDGLGPTESDPSDVSPLAKEHGLPMYPVLLDTRGCGTRSSRRNIGHDRMPTR